MQVARLKMFGAGRPNWFRPVSGATGRPGSNFARRHARRGFSVCYRFTGNRAEAEHLSQEIAITSVGTCWRHCLRDPGTEQGLVGPPGVHHEMRCSP